MDQQSTFPQPSYEPQPAPPPEPPRRRHRLVAGVAATALVAGVGGVGLGYAAGHALSGGATPTASSGTQQVTSGGSGDVETIPGSGWSFSDGSGPGGLDVPVDPFDPQDPSGGGTAGRGGSTDTTTTASAAQITGLVRIVSTMRYAGATAAGTGMVLTSTGEVVTNHHVVEGSTSIKVKVMSTGRTYTAAVVGADAKDDVAVLQLAGASGLSTVTPDTDGAVVGDAVTAVGDANGTVNRLSAATGRITALRRSITTQSEGTATGERLTGLMQISSDVISGDSGGATYDADGEVVGMTTAASSGGADVEGYAVPIAKVLRIVDDLESGVTSSRYDYTRPAFLGVGLDESTATVQGVYPGTPAAGAGITAGDRVTAVDGTRVSTTARLQAAIARRSPGDRVAITWTGTDGTSHAETVTLASGAVE